MKKNTEMDALKEKLRVAENKLEVISAIALSKRTIDEAKLPAIIRILRAEVGEGQTLAAVKAVSRAKPSRQRDFFDKGFARTGTPVLTAMKEEVRPYLPDSAHLRKGIRRHATTGYVHFTSR